MKKIQVRWRHAASGILLGYGVTAALLLAAAAVLAYTSAGEGFIGGLVTAANLIGIFCTGLWAVRSVSANGWLIGGVCGAMNPALLRLAGAIAGNTAYLCWGLAAAVGLGFLAGAVGGIAGINLGYRIRAQKKR